MKCISHYYIELEERTEINFIFENCAVDTCTSIPTRTKDAETESEFGFLRISIEFELKEYESISDGAIFSRPRYLSLLGIISFLLEKPFDVFGLASSFEVYPDGISGLKIPEEIKLNTDNANLTTELTELIKVLEDSKEYEKNLAFSLLDRWRKGLYLEKDTEESLLYNDEATLAYFHVLELLGDVYSNELRNESKDLIKNFVSEFNKEILSFNNESLKSENIAKTKLLSSLLEKDISVGSKILYFLKKFQLYSNQTAFWIKNLIEERNNVAHGRRVHYDKAIFPVQPFFPLNTNNLYPLEYLRVLSAKVISCHLGITAYDSQWNDIEESLIFDSRQVKEFLIQEEFPDTTNVNESQMKIIYGGTNFFVVTKKVKAISTENFFNHYLNLLNEDEEFLAYNVDVIVILYELTENVELETKLKKAIIKIYELECNPHYKFRDMRYYLDFNNFRTPKLEALIIDKQIK